MLFENKKLKINSNDKVLIAPYSNMSLSLSRYLDKYYNTKVLGCIDKNKRDKNKQIYSIEDIDTLKYNKIIIVSGVHSIEIYDTLIKHGIKKSTIQISIPNRTFSTTSYKVMKLQRSISATLLFVQLFLQNKYKNIFENEKNILFISPDFVDINIKDLYIYLDKKNDFNITIATNNKEHVKKFKKEGFNIILYPSLRFVYQGLKSKLKILDHSPVEKIVLQSLLHSKVIQIWHGVPLKKIGHLANYKKVIYDLVISTSNFVTDYAFSKIFSYKKIINSGYPRNDTLIQTFENKNSLVLVNHDIYNFVKYTNLKIILYMPTWRGNSFELNPINLNELNTFAKKNNLFIIFKMHPFIHKDSFFDTIDSRQFNFTKDYKHNLVFYPSADDIYPLLPLSKLLITDYSSVYFDYLLLNKPIIFFIYDIQSYISTQGDFMLEFDKYTPGLKPTSYKQLEVDIFNALENDSFKNQRLILKEKLFNLNTLGKSSQIIFNAIKVLSKENINEK